MVGCLYWSLWYYNPEYGIYQGEAQMVHQGYAFLLEDRFEALSCALSVNKIGRRPERLQLISPEFNLSVIGAALDVVIRVIDLRADTVLFSDVPCFSTTFPIESIGWKKEIYIGLCNGNYYAINMDMDYEKAKLCAWLFHQHGRFI
jgi:hypothetical protein